MVHKWMAAYFWIWFTVVSPGVRLDFVNHLVLCRSPSTGPIGLNNLLSCANVNCKIHFSSVPDSQIGHGCLSHLMWTAGSWMQRPQYLGKPSCPCFVNTRVFLGCLCLPCRAGLWGKLSSSFFPSPFHLSPLCSSLTAFLPKLPICSIDEESLSQLWLYFSVSRQ